MAVKENLDSIFKTFNNLNTDKTHKLSKDDICTPMECVKLMLDYIPSDFWKQDNIRILDPCCGNGNFGAYAMFKTDIKNIYFNEINKVRLQNCKNILNPPNLSEYDFLSLEFSFLEKFDLIMANPPYSGGGNKNRSLSNKFIESSIDKLNDKGYLCFVTPNNYMTYNNNNTTLKKLLESYNCGVINNWRTASTTNIKMLQSLVTTRATLNLYIYDCSDEVMIIEWRNEKSIPFASPKSLAIEDIMIKKFIAKFGIKPLANIQSDATKI